MIIVSSFTLGVVYLECHVRVYDRFQKISLSNNINTCSAVPRECFAYCKEDSRPQMLTLPVLFI